MGRTERRGESGAGRGPGQRRRGIGPRTERTGEWDRDIDVRGNGTGTDRIGDGTAGMRGYSWSLWGPFMSERDKINSGAHQRELRKEDPSPALRGPIPDMRGLIKGLRLGEGPFND